ncbi:XAP5, circadian clock regulator-domain-containing protein [Ilyonectria robusta]|uniref:XAP5, circadian clock regulator-domain-containing protein n=1 Tax=Ilyonectria robusta TaxID=1079257 RepID=UPI001E8CAD1F|nr:XAP5, circadian clock regulator-domain-containing protein [Ilyonectria robusta]KAH8688230.1 XAP5, circadian clock regulator-domain-containing protein [Ilyonectria robusta]
MSDKNSSRFTPQNKTTNERLSTHTVGLVALSDFRKRRAEVLEQQEREAHEAAFSGTSTPDRSVTDTPDNAGSDAGDGARPVKKKKKKKQGKKLLSFDDEEEDGQDAPSPRPTSKLRDTAADGSDSETKGKAKFKANAAVGIVPKSMTKAALRKEADERDTLRREFLALQEAVKATEIAIPFVFYDGTNIPGGTVRVKKGDYTWVFLDKSRKVGAELGVGEKANARREWARVGVDDLMFVRGTVIIPHHYDFYFFAMNKALGPGGQPLFEYSADPPKNRAPTDPAASPLTTPASKAAALRALPDINTLEGATDDPNLTKVVDRRWFEKNKHIYPASVWQEFDPEKDYSSEVRKDAGGNTFFFSR